MKIILIQGSARSDGNTAKIVQLLQQYLDFEVLDLKDHKIEQFDYDHKNQEDDFLPIIRKIVSEYDVVIFATPVYWYSMSGLMKVFFDRITDCLKIEKDTGRKLRGMKMAMLSCGSEAALNDGFEVPFRESADYLGMEYLGEVHTWIEEEMIEEEVKRRVLEFAKKLQ